MDSSNIGYVMPPSPIDIAVFFINALAVLSVGFLAIKMVFYAIKRKLVRSHKLNLYISLIPTACSIYLLRNAILGYVGAFNLLLFSVLIPLSIVFAISFLLSELMDFFIFLPKKYRWPSIVILVLFLIFFYPKTVNRRFRYFGIIDTGPSAFCKCAGAILDGEYCFGLPYSYQRNCYQY